MCSKENFLQIVTKNRKLLNLIRKNRGCNLRYNYLLTIVPNKNIKLILRGIEITYKVNPYS